MAHAGGRFDATVRRVFLRRSIEDLPAHLGSCYGIEVGAVHQLDVGVLRVDHATGTWVARVFSADRPAGSAAGDAAAIAHAAAHAFPAERLAADEPVSVLDGQDVLVTTFVQPVKAKLERDVWERLGRLLGRLHALPVPAGRAARPSGALHHFAEGDARAELDAAIAWCDDIEAAAPAPDGAKVDVLRTALLAADDGVGLPECFVHPDATPRNMVRTADGYALVDWTGAGVGPRVASLAWLLGTERSAGGVARGYGDVVTLTEEELERLGAVLLAKHLVYLTWKLGFAPENVGTVARRVSALRRSTARTAAAARAALVPG